MENFIMHNPTTLHFGRSVVEKLAPIASSYGRRVLLVYGKGSAKRSGAYVDVLRQLKNINAEVFEFSGIQSNPLIEDVDAAAQLGREKQVDMIIAIGGGSVIDSAKAISITMPVIHSGWVFYAGKAKPSKAIPLIAVLTLAATGSEMNQFSVVQNHAAGMKNGFGHPLMYPVHSFLDPSYTLSVPRDYTAFGIADLMAHCLENYFGLGHAPLTDHFIFSILTEALEAGPQLLNDLDNYDLRARIMYAATMALNGLTTFGKGMGDWGVHSIGHHLSLLYGLPHGATLTVMYPAWMKLYQSALEPQLLKLGKHLFGLEDAGETIQRLESFFISIGCPVRITNSLPEGIDPKPLIDLMIRNRAGGNHYKFSPLQLEKLIDLAQI
ncbi:MAG: iron-containing alcohol dehydrogenase [Bacteroidales bacterium]|nr:iron-containing alcohol dehydrogenase [Bacteroidales bacterium]MDZ4205202.1 iron-containing alcohol dehydrogenase [Bacteroidales bacterium]